MVATITRKCQNVVDFINRYKDNGSYRERSFSNNTQAVVKSDGSFDIWLWQTKIVEYIASTNEYIIKNGGRRSRTTSHDIRAYLHLLLWYGFERWSILTEDGTEIPGERYSIWYGSGLKWIFNPTKQIFRWED